MSTVKTDIQRAADRLADELEALSRQIHDHPELAYQEVQACGWLSDSWPRRASRSSGAWAGWRPRSARRIETGAGPTIAILCEYDALPGIGHACGHNVIATSGAGAGAALAAVRAQLPAGRIQVIGTPAEEGGGGKVQADQGRRLPGRGLRDDDPRLRPHASCTRTCSASCAATFEFTGKAAHASADPWEGVNALDAVHPDLQRGQHAAPAGAARLPDPRHHHQRRRGAEHHPRVRGRDLLRAGAAHRHDVGALPARGRLRRGRGQGDRVRR